MFKCEKTQQQKEPGVASIDLSQILKHFEGRIIDNRLLEHIVESYIENPDVVVSDLNEELFKEKTQRKTGIESYNLLINMQSHYIYQLGKGMVNIIIVCLTMLIIPMFNVDDDTPKSSTILTIQVALIFLSLIEQSIGVVVRGFKKTFNSLLLTFEMGITLLALIIGLIFVSFSTIELLLQYKRTSSLFKIYALATICKTISVIMFLRIIREIRIVIDVLINSALFLIDVIGMMGIVMMLFSSVGLTLFGGIINSKSVEGFEDYFPQDDGQEYLNFNDYLNALTLLFVIILSGWQDPLRMLSYANPHRCLSHNYFFVAFFVCTNLFLLNVLIGFIIDNIVAYLSEDSKIESQEHRQIKEELKNSLVYKASQKIFNRFFKQNRPTSYTQELSSMMLDKQES